MDNIAIIGAGNLGQSIAKGLIEKEIVKKEELILTQRKKPSEALLAQGFQVINSNSEAVEKSKIILLCVQPQQVNDILKEVAALLTPDHLVVSTLTGVSMAKLQAEIPEGVPVIRSMPNTAAAAGASMTCLSVNESSHSCLPLAEKLFSCIGETLVIEEEMMQAATVLGASGIAFLMRYLRAATQAGVQMGFDSYEAQEIAVQTAKGASLLLQKAQSHPEVEIDKVTTPKGCTIAGLNEMEHQGFSSALIKGVMTSFEKITKIKEEL
ncbi:MAG: pyrroline-5-carboxylate reductase [Bacteroidota bacterium]